MAALILPRRFYSQPQGEVHVDWSNPIARGLVFLFNGSNYSDAVNKSLASVSGSPGQRATANGIGPDISGTQYLEFVDRDSYDVLGELSIVWRGIFDATTGAYRCPISKADTNGATATPFENHIDTTVGKWRFIRANTSHKSHLLDTTAMTAGALVTVGISAPAAIETAPLAWVNRTSQSISSADTGTGAATGNTKGIRIGRRSDDATQLDGTCLFAGVWNRRLSEAEYFALYENPWQIFKARSRVLYFDVAAGGTPHNLEAAAAAQATAAGALSVSVPLAAAGLSVATAGGALALSIPLDAAATATANASGGLSLSIPLAASAVAQALASAGITQATPLGGDAAAVAGAAGLLSLNISLAGTAIAEAGSSAGLTVTTSGLAGDAAAQASASADLSLAIPLSGASLAVSGASGNLTQLVPVSGSAASASMATGGLDVSVQLSGAALAQALAAAGLTVDGGMGGAAAAEASAGGTITLRVNLEGNAVAQAIAAGALSADGLIVAGTPGYKVSRTPRTWKVSRTPRSWRISA